MASIVSTLSLADQVARLREFIAECGANISDGAATNICRAIALDRPTDSQSAARSLVAGLAAHGVVIKYSPTLEAVARLCGQPNWMRQRQVRPPFDADGAEHVRYGLQALKSEVNVTVELFPSLALATNRLLELLAADWPKEVACSVCSLNFSDQMILVELEHPSADWLQFKVCRFEAPSSDLASIPHEETRAFCARMTRTLEYTYPGLLVVNSLRSATLPPSCYLVPHLHQLNTGFKTACWGDLEFLPLLDGVEAEPTARVAGGVLHLETREGPIEITPVWASNSDAELRVGELSGHEMNALLHRIARLRRVTGGSINQLVARVMAGPDGSEDCCPVDKEALTAAMREVNLTPKQLALLADLPLNVVRRTLKYGYAHETVIPRLSDALGMTHPNELLPPEKSEGTGVRLQDGATFLRALKATHMWRRIIGESLQGKEADEVNRIAEELQDCVEVLQFRTGSLGRNFVDVNGVEQPLDEKHLAQHVQELLDELTAMQVAVVVSDHIRFGHGSGRLKGLEGLPLHNGTLFFEKVAMLKSPGQSQATA